MHAGRRQIARCHSSKVNTDLPRVQAVKSRKMRVSYIGTELWRCDDGTKLSPKGFRTIRIRAGDTVSRECRRGILFYFDRVEALFMSKFEYII